MTTKAQQAAYQRRRYEANKCLADTFLTECVDCGNEDPVVLEFDHVSEGSRPRERRSNRPGQGRRNLASQSRPSMLRELDLCEVRCANCHKRRHRGSVLYLGL